MAESGLIDAPLKCEQLPKQSVHRRKFHRSKSLVRRIFQQKEGRADRLGEEGDLKAKNIRQTELVLDLRNAILQLCAHFAECKEDQHRGKPFSTQVEGGGNHID